MKKTLKNKGQTLKLTTLGFTLIELLAVIVILAVIALIATPLIMNVIDDAKQGSAQDSAYAIIKAGELKVAREKLVAPIVFSETSDIEYKGSKPEKMDLVFNKKGQSKVQIFLDGICMSKNYTESKVKIEDTKTTAEACVTETLIINVDITDGLIPVTYDTSGTTVKADTNGEWYDYSNKKWANAVSVKSSERSKYTSASVGTQILEDDILGYFVYIPRYRYLLWNGENESKPEQEIKIAFEQKNSKKSSGTKNGEWLTHPAFTFGGSELNGIWVGKFELTGIGSNPTTKPNSYSLTNQNVATAFNTIKRFQTDTEYGLTSYDAHMMKNMEWGATSYLSHSKYGTCNNGTCSEVWNNNTQTGTSYSSSITGCSGTSISAGVKYNMTTCEENRDYKKNGVKASTTGNIYGIYDMSGGTYERVMASTTDNNGNFISHFSGFSNTPDSKYWDKYGYSISGTDYTVTKLGDAIKEVRKGTKDYSQGWYNEGSYIPHSSAPWFNRGGYAGHGWNAGLFSEYHSGGNEQSHFGSRAVLVKE